MLQCVAVYGNMLQYGHNVLQNGCNVLQYSAMCCSMVQCVAVCCNVTLGSNSTHTETFNSTTFSLPSDHVRVAVCCSMLQYVAVCCSALQYVAVCYSML